MTFIWTSNSFVSPNSNSLKKVKQVNSYFEFERLLSNLTFKIFLNPTHGVKFVFNCIVLRNFIGVCCLSRAWQGGAGASASWSDSGLEISARHRLCQGAIYVLAGCGLVWYQELLGGSKGPSLPRSQMFKFKIIYLRRLTTGQAGDHGTLHPGAISAVWEIFCSESSQTRKMFLSCRNIKRILIWYLVKYKISVWFLCVYADLAIFSDTISTEVTGNREAQQTVRGYRRGEIKTYKLPTA